MQGQNAPVEVAEGQLSIGGAQITRSDIMAKNGVIHVIDKVNIPEAKPH
ncbi:fasciclin domain-containing protein [Rhizobium sp. RHZ02]